MNELPPQMRGYFFVLKGAIWGVEVDGLLMNRDKDNNLTTYN
jgi:hypothetical protein